MSSQSTAIDRDAVRAELRKVFDPPTAEVLLDVLDGVVGQLRTVGNTREDFRELKQVVVDLGAGQARTDQTVHELVAAQGRTDQAVRELAAAQARTDEALRELAAAQARTDQAVGALAAAQARTERALERLSRQVGGLSETVGGDIEDIAYIVLHDVLKREFGWKVGLLERSWQKWNGHVEEINVFGQAEDPARAGARIWVVGEAKHNLTKRDVARFRYQAKRARKHLVGEVFPVCFCYRARPEVQQLVKDAGIRLVFSYGRMA